MPESVRPEFVGTLHKYMTQVAKEADLLPPYPHDPELIQYYYQTDLPEAAAYALLETGELFDKIVVDEAQDLIRDSYLDVMGGCLKKDYPEAAGPYLEIFYAGHIRRGSLWH